MFPTLPHTEQDIREMLAVAGAASIEELFADIPPRAALSAKAGPAGAPS